MNVAELRETYLKRVAELRKRVANPRGIGNSEERTEVDAVFIGTMNLTATLYGSASPQVKALMEMHKNSNTKGYTASWLIQSFAESLDAVLRNTREEIELGLISSIATEVAGVVIGDLLLLAKSQLAAGYKDVAAVLASAALEDALKRKADELGISVEGKTLDTVINALKAKGFFKGAQAPIVASYAKLRNAAMHADWPKIADSDVSSLIGFLEPFLLQHFS
ncbi:MAG TPA: DUF4145 domain-containing protein [Thermoanaerobaculia bacterium]|jgi:hypothetical protein|nr:DUF4145 domain-containing protein [Thermoanaerobaculia bacterium]